MSPCIQQSLTKQLLWSCAKPRRTRGLDKASDRRERRRIDTLEPVDYYFKVPGDAAERDFFLLDPMLATGGSAAAAVTSLKRAGATRIRFLCLVAAPEGVRRLAAAHPDVIVYCAALDRELNAQGYILPGLGDAGDRLFGTR